MDDRTISPDGLLGSIDKKKNGFSVSEHIVYCVIVLVLLFFVLVGYFISFIQVSGSSMLDTLEQDQFIIFQKRGYTLKRGDIITIKEADPDDLSKILIKRLIAFEGDTFMFMKSDNSRYVDLYLCKSGETHFELCDEPYIREKMSSYVEYNYFTVAPYIDYITDVDLSDEQSQNAEVKYILNETAVTIPEGYFLFLGDNRNISLDSREYGLQPRSNITGKAIKFLNKTSFMHKLLNFLYN